MKIGRRGFLTGIPGLMVFPKRALGVIAPPPDLSLPARSFVASLTEKRKMELRSFYFGEQWPAAVVAERQKNGRPCLTFNRLPAIFERRVNGRRLAGEPVTCKWIDDTVLEITARYKDSQRLYNYYRTRQVEDFQVSQRYGVEPDPAYQVMLSRLERELSE